jgi:hypothetical protein
VPTVNLGASLEGFPETSLEAPPPKLSGVNHPDYVAGNEHEYVCCIQESESLQSQRGKEIGLNVVDVYGEESEPSKEIDPPVSPAMYNIVQVLPFQQIGCVRNSTIVAKRYSCVYRRFWRSLIRNFTVLEEFPPLLGKSVGRQCYHPTLS